MIHWSRATLCGTGFEDEEGSPLLADSEETPRSGVQTCNDPLRGICCKARCRTAEETQKVTKERGIPCDRVKFGGETENPHLGAGVRCVAIQISEHTGERVDVGINFGVIACWFFRAAVLRARQTRESVEFKAADFCTVEATENTTHH